MEKTSTQLAEEDLARYNLFRKAQEDAIGFKTKPSESAFHVARNVFREEIGYFGDYDGMHYNLSDAEKNILLAHGRQDAATAAVAAMNALDRLPGIERSLRHIQRLLWALLFAFLVVSGLYIAMSR